MGAALGPAVGGLLLACPWGPSVPAALVQITLRPERWQFLSRGWSRLGRGWALSQLAAPVRSSELGAPLGSTSEAVLTSRLRPLRNPPSAEA